MRTYNPGFGDGISQPTNLLPLMCVPVAGDTIRINEAMSSTRLVEVSVRHLVYL